jgi:CheY-like chemotaxis protein
MTICYLFQRKVAGMVPQRNNQMLPQTDIDVPHNRLSDDFLRMLVVDDDPIQNEFISAFFGNEKTRVVMTRSGEEGLEALKGSSFDVILVDHDMPGMNGLEFLRAVRSDAAHGKLPMIMVTIKSDAETENAAYEAGASFFHTKPVDWRLLSQQIKSSLRNARR